MKRISKSSLKWILAVFFALQVMGAQAESPLATQLRQLRNSLPINDPSRQTLTLRLADTLFADALRGRTDLDAKGLVATDDLKRMQRESLAMYETSLKAEEGRRISPAGDDRFKIEFQRARLYQDLGDTKQAMGLYHVVEAGTGVAALKRESVLRIAEMEEQANPHAPVVEAYYKKTLELCQGTDLCSYAHYRLAWFYRNQGENAADLSKALAEMKLALWDSKGSVREEALRDYILFTGLDGSDGVTALVEFDTISQKIGRPQLLGLLSDSYLSAGNKKAGVKVLEVVHARSPKLYSGIRLLEETYGQRNWTAVDTILTQMGSPEIAAQSGSFSDLERSESEKILKRVSIQLDQERQQNAERGGIFHGVVDLYLALYPASSDRLKMMEGWLLAEPMHAAKLAKISTWISSVALKVTLDEQTRLRELAISSSQKEKDQDAIIAQTSALEQLLAPTGKYADKVREYQYLKARANYEKKDYSEAMPIFQRLAAVDGASEPDTFAVQSQNLALDIFNQQKDFSSLKKQSELWTKNPKLANRPSLKKEMAEMLQVGEQAEFQMFTTLGETPEAGAQFLKLCSAGKFRPQSCENAKVLAVKQGNQTALIEVLRIMGKGDELSSELEAAGFFRETADLQAKNAKTVRDQLKVALLYELALDNASRERVLAGVLKSPGLKKSFADDESALHAMIAGSDFIQPSLLSLAWSAPMKLKIADEIEVLGRSNAISLKILAASADSTGSGWSKVTLAEFKKLWEKEHEISFYGKKSKALFDQRMAAMKKLSSYSEKVLNGADLKTRLIILQAMTRSFQALGMAILDSPVPAELNPEQSTVLKQTLSDLATPFLERSGHFGDLFKEQAAKLTVASDQEFGKNLETAKDLEFTVPVAPKASFAANAIREELTQESAERAITKLHEKPADTAALEQLKKFYDSKGMGRLAAYFEGRLMSLKGEKP